MYQKTYYFLIRSNNNSRSLLKANHFPLYLFPIFVCVVPYLLLGLFVIYQYYVLLQYYIFLPFSPYELLGSSSWKSLLIFISLNDPISLRSISKYYTKRACIPHINQIVFLASTEYNFGVQLVALHFNCTIIGNWINIRE